MKCKKILILITVIFLTFTMNYTCFANNADKNKITNDFELTSYSSINDEVQYGVYAKKDDENVVLSIKATDYNLPSNLYKYKDDIRLRITYSQVDYKVLECKVINNKTGEIIEDLSEENMNKLFSIEYGKTIIENSWVDEIKLSTLKEYEVYKYTASATVQFPKIINDVGENCIIYIKQWYDETYKKEPNMYNNISSTAISGSFNEYKAGDTFYIMYKKASTEELLKLIEHDKIIYLSKYNDGDTLDYKFKDYIYNDTQNDITVNVKSTNMGVEKADSTIIGRGQIYGFSWMIDSATISFSENSNNEENKNQEQAGDSKEENENEEQKGKQGTKTSGKDNTLATGKLPQTGVSSTIIISLVVVTIISIIIYKKYDSYKDIK